MNMKVKIAGVEFKNPVIAASGTFGFGREYGEFYDVNALGGICTKGLTLRKREGNPPPRIAETASGLLNSVGLQNPGFDGFLSDDVPFLDKLDTVVIVNVAGGTEREYVELTSRVSALSCVDMVELNISCPNVKCGGMAFGVLPKSVEQITSAVKKVCKKPLIVKLSPNVASIADNARAAQGGGADALSLINTLAGMAVDWRKREPVLHNNIGGLSGPAVKPVALKMVCEAYKAVKIPIIGMGGISTPDDAAEFMVAGAAAVQVGSANIFCPSAAIDLVNGLTNLAKSCNIDSIGELTGSLKWH
ncbi:MAG: dihydroorotate dehydrogenase [Clostridiales bacterium]|jgi:dihydroorotate dehydrogenase (NAD+) catalytic subunit|nr:dihydroorotate dehydrogenase [Clostridiales bacterium]